MNNKVIEKVLRYSPRKQSPIALGVLAKSKDLNSFEFNIRIVDQNNNEVFLEDKELTIMTHFMETDRKIYHKYTLQNNRLNFLLDTKYIHELEHVQTYVYMKDEGRAIDIGSFYYEVEVSFIDKPVTEAEYEKIDSLHDLYLIYKNTIEKPLEETGSYDKHYKHYQQTPSDIWEIEHNLYKYPTPICYDTTGKEIEGDVTNISDSKMQITFSVPVSGNAFLN